MLGLPHSNDRLWSITTTSGKYQLSDYNDEITGYDKELQELAPNDIHYGGNAYYILFTLAPKKGWKVDRIDSK